MIRSFRATLVKLKEMFSWYAIGNRVEIPPYPFHTSLGPRNIRFNLHRVKNLHSLAMRIHPGISPKRKINTIEIIFFKKCPSLLRHSLTSKQETKNIPEKTTLQANVPRFQVPFDGHPERTHIFWNYCNVSWIVPRIEVRYPPLAPKRLRRASSPSIAPSILPN